MAGLGPQMMIKIGANTKSAEAGIRRVTNAFSNFKKFVTVVVAGKMVKDMANFGKELSLMADRTGMSIEKLSALRNVFMSAGSGARGFQQTIERINSGLLGLKRGESHLAAQLAPLGINPFGKDAGQILEEIADAAKAQLSMGRSRESVLDYLTNVIGIDPAIAQKLMEGREAFLKEEARLLGKVGKVSDENDANLKELHKSLGELNSAWTNMTANIIGFVAPAITKLADCLSYLFKEIGEGNPWAIIGGSAAFIGGSILSKMLLKWAIKTLGGWLVGATASTAVATASTAIAGSTTAATAGGALAGIGKIFASPAFITGCTILGNVLMAVAALSAGMAIGKWISQMEWFQKMSEGIGDLWTKFFGSNPYDIKDPRHMEYVIDKLQSEGKISEEQANKRREELGLPRKEKLFDNEKVLNGNEIENLKPNDMVVEYLEEPLISNEDYEKPILPTKQGYVEVHMENSTYYGISPENAEDISSTFSDQIRNSVQVSPT